MADEHESDSPEVEQDLSNQEVVTKYRAAADIANSACRRPDTERNPPASRLRPPWRRRGPPKRSRAAGGALTPHVSPQMHSRVS